MLGWYALNCVHCINVAYSFVSDLHNREPHIAKAVHS